MTPALWASATQYDLLKEAELEDVFEEVKLNSQLFEQRFLDVASLATSRTVVWEDLRDPVEFATVLLAVEKWENDLNLVKSTPELDLVWRHIPRGHQKLTIEEAALSERTVYVRWRWWKFHASVGELELVPYCSNLLVGRRITFFEPKVLTEPWFDIPFLGFNGHLNDLASATLQLFGLKPWFESQYELGLDPGFDLSLTRLGRGVFQVMIDWEPADSLELTALATEVQFDAIRSGLVFALSSSPGVLEVIEEDREVVWFRVKGWKRPVKDFREMLERHGAPLAGLTVDPEIESG
jgi:hypothetical protein